MKDRQKHIILSRYWVGDTVYHVVDGERGIVIKVMLGGDPIYVRYHVVFADDRAGEECDENELCDERPVAAVG